MDVREDGWNKSLLGWRTMYSKQGKILQLPPEFLQEFPSVVLDGELWTGREGPPEVLFHS